MSHADDPPQPGVKRVAMKTCPVCGTPAFLATRLCKADCGWDFIAKAMRDDKVDGGMVIRQQQERKRAKPVEEHRVSKQGNVTTHTGIDPEDDGNMDHCIVCGDIGTLICCDMCPLSYHADCAGLDNVPSGFWSCPQCTAKNLAASTAGVVAGAMQPVKGANGVNGTGSGIAAASSGAPVIVSAGLQNGLDAFHQKLNACLDYTDTQTYECDGYTFMCFRPPDLNLLSTDPAKLAVAQEKRAATLAKAQAQAAAQAATAAATNTATTSSALAAESNAPSAAPTSMSD